MTQYVCCYVQYHGKVLLIEKRKPAWQLGKFNLPGGKVEEGETAEEAAIRELFEEANLEARHARTIGRITGPDWEVYVIQCGVLKNLDIKQKTSERVFWMEINEALREDRLIQNLLAVIPLAAGGIKGWAIYEGPHLPKNQYIIELPPCVSLPI